MCVNNYRQEMSKLKECWWGEVGSGRRWEEARRGRGVGDEIKMIDDCFLSWTVI